MDGKKFQNHPKKETKKLISGVATREDCRFNSALGFHRISIARTVGTKNSPGSLCTSACVMSSAASLATDLHGVILCFAAFA